MYSWDFFIILKLKSTIIYLFSKRKGALVPMCTMWLSSPCFLSYWLLSGDSLFGFFLLQKWTRCLDTSQNGARWSEGTVKVRITSIFFSSSFFSRNLHVIFLFFRNLQFTLWVSKKITQRLRKNPQILHIFHIRRPTNVVKIYVEIPTYIVLNKNKIKILWSIC